MGEIRKWMAMGWCIAWGMASPVPHQGAAWAQTVMPGGEKRQKAIEFEDSTVEGLNRERADLNTMSKSWKDRRKNHLYQAQKENFFKDAEKATMRELRYSQ